MKGGTGATLRDANRHGLFLPSVQIWALRCSCFTRDLGVIWRRRGQRRRPYSLKSPRGRILIVFPHWFASNLDIIFFLKMAICCPQGKDTLCQKSHRCVPKLCHTCVKVVLRLSYAENQGLHVLVNRKAKIFTANSFWLSRNQWKHTILEIPPLVANWAIWSLVIA